MDSGDTHFGQAVEGWTRLHNGQSGFFPLVNGMDALGARLDMIEKAEKSVDMQYFLMKDDTSGQVVTNALIEAADRGVRVRFLLDDVFTSASDRTLLLMSQHPNIEVRLFNPVSRRGLYSLNFVGSFRTANRRMHNKSFTADNAISIVGGRNIADEYFQLKGDEVFADFDLLAFGEIARAVSTSFDIYWNHKLAIPIEQVVNVTDSGSLESERSRLAVEAKATYEAIYEEALSSEILQDLITGNQPLFVADAVVIADDPDKLVNPVSTERMGLATDVDKVLRQAEQELIFISPYYVPGDDGVQYARDIINRGTRVVVVTNSLASNNHVAVHSGYSGYRKDVIEAGVELYEIRADAGNEATDGAGPEKLTLHTKLILIDRRYLFVGSLNLDPRSLEINAEMGLLVDSEELVSAMAAGLKDDLPSVAYRVTLDDEGRLQWRGEIDGKRVTETTEPLANRWLRFKSWFLKIAPESQL
ncbi:MAG: phospholipase D family protein [Rhodothermales bacterium]|nr:phospholipase D family protein [Rhodothermales bacterium]